MATKTWAGTGGINLNWSSSGNWAPAGVPAAGDDVVFNTGANNCVVDGNVGQAGAGELKSLVMTNEWSGVISGGRNIYITHIDDSPSLLTFNDTAHTWTTSIYLNQRNDNEIAYVTWGNKPFLGQVRMDYGKVYYLNPIISKSGEGIRANAEIHLDGLSDTSGLFHQIQELYASSGRIKFGNCTVDIGSSTVAGRIYAPSNGTDTNALNNITFIHKGTGSKSLYFNNPTVGIRTLGDIKYYADGSNDSGLLDFGYSNINFIVNKIAMHSSSPGVKSITFRSGKTTTFVSMASGFENGQNRTTLYSSSAGTVATLTNSNASVVNKCDWLNLKDITFTGLWEIGDNNIVQTKVTGCRVKATGMRFGE